jgi:hypothetical protein
MRLKKFIIKEKNINMKKIRITAVILIMCTLGQIFTACAGNDSAGETAANTAGEVIDDSVDSDVPDEPAESKLGFSVSNVKEDVPDDANFNGRDFVIMVENPSEKVWTYTNMVVEEETGDTIDDAFYRRNRRIEERFNISIKQREVPVGNQNEFKKEVESGAGSIDAALLSYNAAARLATSNYCVPLNEVPYIDLDKPWWDQGSRRDLSIAKHNFLMASDISICDNDNTWLIYFDKTLTQDLGLESPYKLVDEGRWTFDKLYEMMKTAEFDVDGDGQMTMDDRFGFLTHGENYAGMWIAAGQRLVTKNADDMPEISFGSETFVNVWQKIVEIMNDTSCKADDIGFISTGLANGQTLFGTEILKFVRDYRENEREFGIIPMPKFNEQQENHHTYVAVSAPLLIIPKSNPDMEGTGIIVEAMAAEGHRTILPAYYEVAIAGKFVRDEESIAMLDIAFATRMYDLGVVFDWGSMASQLRSTGERNDGGIAALIERRGESMQNAMEKTFETFDEY